MIAAMRVLLAKPAWAWPSWLPWLLFGVVGGVFFPTFTLLLLVMAIMASVIERARGAWVAYLVGVALVWVPFLIAFRTGFPIGIGGPTGIYELVILGAAGLGLLLVGVPILREHLGWWRAMAASRRERRAP